jgi:hypothetical protein
MILFSSAMRKEIVAAIALAVIILGALLAYFFVVPGDQKETIETIEIGDCVDVYYILRYASNNTVYQSSYADVENKTDGTPLNVFVSFDPLEWPPEGYEA